MKNQSKKLKQKMKTTFSNINGLKIFFRQCLIPARHTLPPLDPFHQAPFRTDIIPGIILSLQIK